MCDGFALACRVAVFVGACSLPGKERAHAARAATGTWNPPVAGKYPQWSTGALALEPKVNQNGENGADGPPVKFICHKLTPPRHGRTVCQARVDVPVRYSTPKEFADGFDLSS